MRYAACAALVAALVLAGNASARTSKWSHLTLQQKRVVVRREIEARRHVVRWWIRYGRPTRFPAAATPVVRFKLVRCTAIGIRSPGWVCVQAQYLVRALAVERRLNARILAASWPPHMALWNCIHGHEAADWQNDNTGGNGHYGGLQMHPGWGYGTSEYASDDSEFVIVWAAEHGYKASGYSRTWLMGQWFHPDCLAYA